MTHHLWAIVLLFLASSSFAGSPTKATTWNDLNNESESFGMMFELSQSDTDKVHMRNGRLYVGEVKTVKERTVEFYDYSTELNFELAQDDIEVIVLSNGKTLTFAAPKPPAQQQQPPTQQQPAVVKEEDGPPVGLIILATVGIVLVVLLLVGAAAQ